MEKKIGISCRWNTANALFQDLLKSGKKKQASIHLNSLHQMAKERLYLSFDMVNLPSNAVFASEDDFDPSMPQQQKQDIIHSYTFVQRCEEEKVMLQAEMSSMITYFLNMHQIIKDHLKRLPTPGEQSMLLKEAIFVEQQIVRLQQIFTPYLPHVKEFEREFTNAVLNEDQDIQEILQLFL